MISEPNAKLLGLKIDENQEWSTQITGQGGMISALNPRLFIIRRLNNYIGKKANESGRQPVYLQNSVWYPING